MTDCRLCRQPRCAEVLSFGSQPVCHRFAEGNEQQATFPLALGQCDVCGLVQLMQPMPLEMIVPRYDWIMHNEPEAHLAAMAERIASLPGISRDSLILGVFDHDEPLLRHLRAAGYHRAEKLDPVRDLGLADARAGAAIVQNRMDRQTAGRIARVHGRADVVISRRVLEHAYEPAEFLRALRSLIHQQGYVVIEVPDCEQAFQQADVAVVWEEHISYFTPDTFRACLSCNGLRLHQLDVYPYPLENALIGMAQPVDFVEVTANPQTLKEGLAQMMAFAISVASLREKLHRHLAAHRANGERIAWLGAGHRSCVYINALQLGEFLECVIDDDSQKQRLNMPGSQLPIRGPDALDDPRITLCVLCINPAVEDRVIEKNKQFTRRGGVFGSVSPGSRYSLL